MNIVDAIATILTHEGVTFLSCFPIPPMIQVCAAAGIRPQVCAQERVGVGIADGYSRITNGHPVGVFAMPYGPGAENAFPGVATAFSDATPVLLLPLGHPRDRAQVFPLFSSVRTYASVTRAVETLHLADEVSEVMRRAFNCLKNDRPGPVMVEVPADVALAEVSDSVLPYTAVKSTRPAGDPRDIEAAARVLVQARHPLIHAGQGVLCAEATPELIELADLLQIPVMTTLEGKSAFPEDHPLTLGSGSGVMSRPVSHVLGRADVVFAIGTGLTTHGMATTLPPGQVIIHATNDVRDLNKNYQTAYPILGDARLVLRQMIDAVKDLRGAREGGRDGAVAAEITQVREGWWQDWRPTLASDAVPLNPYRIIWDFMHTVEASEAIVTHDSGGPRDQLMPFYRATAPRSYIGWGKSHALGTGLGLIIGAKLAAPGKFCVNFMGDAAFGMTGLDFETAVGCGIPITTIVLNHASGAIERRGLAHPDASPTRVSGANDAELGRSLGGYAERIDKPDAIIPAIQRARRMNDEGRAVLLEFITCDEPHYSHRRGL
jgi:acetolactate synthase I/II/III large subunit